MGRSAPLAGQRGSRSIVLLMFDKPLVGRLDAALQRNACGPADLGHSSDVQQFSRCSVRFRVVPMNLATIPTNFCHELSQFGNAVVDTGADIDGLIVVVVFEQKVTRIREVVGMQELAARTAGTPPARHAVRTVRCGAVKSPNHRRKHMAVTGMEVVLGDRRCWSASR